ncbi:MAG: D-2-hydroxyacid dehydrogenase [Ktedonobacterales bacterium]
MGNGSRTVLITARFEPQWLERLQALAPDLRIEQRAGSAPGRAGEGEGVSDALWREVEVLYTFTTLPAPEQAPRLRWVQLHSAGVNHVLTQPLFRTDVAFTTASGVHAIPIAEYVLAVTLAHLHRVPRMLEWQGRGQWPPDAERYPLFVPLELWGKTLGIVGYGSIGRQVARLAKGCGMRVLALQRGEDHRDRGFVFPGVGDPEGTLPDRYYPPDELEGLLRESDIVVIALPLTPATRGLFGEAAFRAMKADAYLVNVARGPICDEAALIRALEERWIAGAALDVFWREPLPPEHPLWRLPNVILSPHVTGFTPHYDERGAQIFEENLRRYIAGEPLFNLVDKAQGY